VLWSGDVTIGTFTLDFDTGSLDIWVPSQQYDASRRRYDSKASTTYTKPSTSEPFLAEYIDGEKYPERTMRQTFFGWERSKLKIKPLGK
jgi:hypothetical protein